jgi:hypothetical protein
MVVGTGHIVRVRVRVRSILEMSTNRTFFAKEHLVHQYMVALNTVKLVILGIHIILAYMLVARHWCKLIENT